MANQLQIKLGLVLRPTTLQRCGMPTERRPGIPKPQYAMSSADELGEPVSLSQQASGRRQQRLPGAGQFAATRDAAQNSITNTALQPGDGAGNRSLRDMQLGGRVRERARFGGSHEEAQLPQ